MPLRDGHGRLHDYLRISLTDRCNLRCRYCQPENGVALRPHQEILSLEEILRLANVFVTLGVRKIRLTGGEPSVRRGLVDLVAALAKMPGLETIALTTNGLLLSGLAAPLRAAGLTALNVSLDTLRPDRFRALTRRDGLDRVLAGIDTALAAGFTPLKLNVVAIAGLNDDELLDFVALTRTRPINVRFIEYMPLRDNGWRPDRLLPVAVMRDTIARQHDLLPGVEDARGAWGPTSGTAAGEDSGSTAVALDHRLAGFCGTVSFITPMSEKFCARCSRLRLTADGSLKSCLFRAPEANLRDLMRRGADDSELADRIRTVLAAKAWERPRLHELLATAPSAMIEIGG